MICTKCVFFMEENDYRPDACGRLNSGKIKPNCKHHTVKSMVMSKHNRRSAYTPLDAKLRQLFIDKVRNGMTAKEASRISGIPVTSIYGLARKYDIKLGRGGVKIQDIKRLAKRGLSKKEIATELGSTANNINMRSKKAGMTIRWS